MHPNQFQQVLARSRSTSSSVKLIDEVIAPYPRHIVPHDQHIPAAAHIFRVSDSRKTSTEEHTVVLCMYQADGTERIEFWCSDQYVDGVLPLAQATSRAERTADKCEVAADVPMLSSHAFYDTSAKCNFWRGWRRERKCCSHVACALNALRSRKTDPVEELRSYLNGMRVRPEKPLLW